jgi:hypothetical protein
MLPNLGHHITDRVQRALNGSAECAICSERVLEPMPEVFRELFVDVQYNRLTRHVSVFPHLGAANG